jgi:hypothetical protein
MSKAPLAYPLPATALRPQWRERHAQALAAVAILAGVAALLLRAPIALGELDDVALRILFPAGLAFVLAFAPTPGTAVGRIARVLTVLALVAAMFAGDWVPLMLACFPLVLMASVLLDWAGRRFAGLGAPR